MDCSDGGFETIKISNRRCPVLKRGMEAMVPVLGTVLQRSWITAFRHYDEDDGYSGRNRNRPGIQRMLADIKDGKIKRDTVKDLSRFGRDHLQVSKKPTISIQNSKKRHSRLSYTVSCFYVILIHRSLPLVFFDGRSFIQVRVPVRAVCVFLLARHSERPRARRAPGRRCALGSADRFRSLFSRRGAQSVFSV